MAEYIECRRCDSPYCDGCNNYILSKMLHNRKFNCIMDNHTIKPTADVAEVRHGYWYRHDKKKHGDTCYYCSVCEKMALADCMVWELTDYCPNCGAKMDGKGDV